jgi:hypothetical protein
LRSCDFGCNHPDFARQSGRRSELDDERAAALSVSSLAQKRRSSTKRRYSRLRDASSGIRSHHLSWLSCGHAGNRPPVQEGCRYALITRTGLPSSQERMSSTMPP